MPSPRTDLTSIGSRKIYLYLLRTGETTEDGLKIPEHAAAATFFENNVLSVVVRAHCFAYKRRLRELLIHESIHCAEYVRHIEDFVIPDDCTRAATTFSWSIAQFLENLPREWKRAAGLL